MSRPVAIKKGIAFAFPDVCKTPIPVVGTVPIPYPNIAQLQDAQNVSDTGGGLKIGPSGDAALLQDSEVSSSTGDEAGTAGGIKSGKTKGKCVIKQGSATVLYGSEGKGLARFGDPTTQNDQNAVGTVLSAFPTVLVGG